MGEAEHLEWISRQLSRLQGLVMMLLGMVVYLVFVDFGVPQQTAGELMMLLWLAAFIIYYSHELGEGIESVWHWYQERGA